MRDSKRGTIEDRASDALLNETPAFVVSAEDKLKAYGARYALETLRDTLREHGEPTWTTEDLIDVIDRILVNFRADPILSGGFDEEA